MPLLLQKTKRKTFVPLLLILFFTVCFPLGRLFFSSRNREVFGYSCFIISSGSMEPNYPVGTLIIAKHTPFEKLKAGEIIVFKSKALGGRLAFHRITRITQNGVYTKGDNNQSEDNQLVTKNDYVGKGIQKSYYLGRYITAIRSPLGFLLLFALPLLAFYSACLRLSEIIILCKTSKKHY